MRSFEAADVLIDLDRLGGAFREGSPRIMSASIALAPEVRFEFRLGEDTNPFPNKPPVEELRFMLALGFRRGSDDLLSC